MSRWYRSGKALLSEIAHSRPQKGEAYIWFTGQHGFIISLGGLNLHIDVILNDLPDKDGKSRRAYPHPFDPGEIQKLDVVLCTHNHIDHLNLKTLLPLAEANPSVRFIVPAPFTQLLVDAGIGKDRVLAAKAGESIEFSPNDPDASFRAPHSPFSIIPVPAIHTRFVQDDGEKDEKGDYTALGFILKSEGISIYHSGDTWVTPSLFQVLKTHAPLDIAMLPINGTDWERTAANCIGNMGIPDVVKLARGLPVDMVIPSHYDMMPFNSENPARFADSMYALCPEKRFHILALCERFIYRKEC